MADNTVNMDEAAIAAMFSDWDGPVGQAIDDATAAVEDLAQTLAPVSPTGSKYAPTGFLKSNVHQAMEHHYGDDGFCLGLVGAPVYPYAFIATEASRKGFTINPGHKSVRPAVNRFLETAIDTVPFETFYE